MKLKCHLENNKHQNEFKHFNGNVFRFYISFIKKEHNHFCFVFVLSFIIRMWLGMVKKVLPFCRIFNAFSRLSIHSICFRFIFIFLSLHIDQEEKLREKDKTLAYHILILSHYISLAFLHFSFSFIFFECFISLSLHTKHLDRNKASACVLHKMYSNTNISF